MAERRTSEPRQQHQHQRPSNRMIKTIGAITLVGTIIGVVVVTPILVIFSPVLVPAAITTFLITFGFLSSGGLGIAAISLASWLYHYLTGKQKKLDMAVAGNARDVKQGVEQKTQKGTETSPHRTRRIPLT